MAAFIIYLGYPNWWGTMPMAVFTLLEHCDFFGKTINPFYTHEGSGMGQARMTSGVCVPARRWKKGWLSMAPMWLWRRTLLRNGCESYRGATCPV